MTEYTTNDPISQGIQWLGDAQNWQGADGIPSRLVEHLGYSALTLVISLAIAVPIGLYVGHTGHGRVVIVSIAGMLRALPTLGMITLFALLSTLGLMPAIWALVLLAIPPLLTGVYAGISSVNQGIVDASRSMGMTEWQILFRVEVPNGLKVMLGGFRGGVLQVLATVAVVAYLPLGGLGRYLIDGLSANDYGQVFGGAVLIAVVAILIDGLLALLTRYSVSPGLRVSSQPTAQNSGNGISKASGGTAVGVQGGTS
ncbi:ABC transporter permease [Psychromicrobium sp. YIM B11713]|uniref:ABC transporter permease n=1 Tax=Psychromicrobium sp. YIM B11713 TaxID=3145233 RepID=UPI00374EE2AE